MQHTQSKHNCIKQTNEQLQVLANDDSHRQADHKNITRKCYGYRPSINWQVWCYIYARARACVYIYIFDVGNIKFTDGL